MASRGGGDEADYAACVLGLRDYVEKNGFPGVVLGLSGGIDSALGGDVGGCARSERVHCVMLPYRYTRSSLKDAAACAKALGVRYDMLPIAPAVKGSTCCRRSSTATRDITEENLQAAPAAPS